MMPVCRGKQVMNLKLPPKVLLKPHQMSGQSKASSSNCCYNDEHAVSYATTISPQNFNSKEFFQLRNNNNNQGGGVPRRPKKQKQSALSANFCSSHDSAPTMKLSSTRAYPSNESLIITDDDCGVRKTIQHLGDLIPNNRSKGGAGPRSSMAHRQRFSMANPST